MRRMFRMSPANYGPFEQLVAAIIADQQPKRRQVLLHKSQQDGEPLANRTEVSTEQALRLIDDAVTSGRISGCHGLEAQKLLKAGHPLPAGFLATLGGLSHVHQGAGQC